MSAHITEQLRRVAGGPNRISERLAAGWYPSTHNPETGAVRHDRHVLIWTRNYEASMMDAADEIDRLRAENATLVAQLLHYEGWFGTECRCDDDECPL